MRFKRAELDNRRQIRRDEGHLFERRTNQSSPFIRRVLDELQYVQPEEESPTIRATDLTPRLCRFSQALILFLSLVFVFPFPGRAQDERPTEYQIKAAFLFNFAKFVEWPPEAYSGPASPMVIGVLGDNVFGGSLEQTIRNKTINDRPLQFKAFHSVTEITNCHVLFISPSEEGHFPKIVAALHDASILTVSQSDRFIEAGGMINFVIEENRIRFQINNEAAQKAGLKISSKLLSLAVSSR